MSKTLLNTLVTLNGGKEGETDNDRPLHDDVTFAYTSSSAKEENTAVETEQKRRSLLQLIPETKTDIALATPTFAIPSPSHPPGISYLDISCPLDLNIMKLPAPVTITANGNLNNLGQFTRHGKKRDSRTLSIMGELKLPASMNPSGNAIKRQRLDSMDLSSKLKSPIAEGLMLPQNTPPFHPKKAPSEKVPDIEEEKTETVEKPSSKSMTTSTTLPTVKHSAGNGSGSSCHQCKSRCTLSSLILCKNTPATKGKGKRQGCRKKYCDRCLNKFYNENSPVPGQEIKWACPACRGICRCAACRRQKAKHANGGLGLSSTTNAVDDSTSM